MAYNKSQCQSFHLNSKKSTAKEQHRKVKCSAVLTRKTLGFWNVEPRTVEQTTAHTLSTAVMTGVTGFATLSMGTVVLGAEVRELGVGVETGKEPLPSWIVELAVSIANMESCVQASWHIQEGKAIDSVLTAPHTTYRSEAFSGRLCSSCTVPKELTWWWPHPQCPSEFFLPSVRDTGIRG